MGDLRLPESAGHGSGDTIVVSAGPAASQQSDDGVDQTMGARASSRSRVPSEEGDGRTRIRKSCKGEKSSSPRSSPNDPRSAWLPGVSDKRSKNRIHEQTRNEESEVEWKSHQKVLPSQAALGRAGHALCQHTQSLERRPLTLQQLLRLFGDVTTPPTGIAARSRSGSPKGSTSPVKRTTSTDAATETKISRKEAETISVTSWKNNVERSGRTR